MDTAESNTLNLDETISDNTVQMFEATPKQTGSISNESNDNQKFIIKKGNVLCIFLFRSKIPLIVIGPHCKYFINS